MYKNDDNFFNTDATHLKNEKSLLLIQEFLERGRESIIINNLDTES